MDLEKPIFVIGTPRSGSTYFASLLNSHPQILMTNETRVMVFASRMISSLLESNWCIEGEKELFKDIAFQHAKDMVLEFYTKLNRKAARRWGDKFPHYADAKLDPQCLSDINKLFPKAQFIHLTRDPRAVTASVINKYQQNQMSREEGLKEGIDVWKRCTKHALEFSKTLTKHRFFNIRYEDLMKVQEKTIKDLFSFLDEEISEEVKSFLEKESTQPTSFSLPTSEITNESLRTDTWDEKLTEQELAAVEKNTKELGLELGYSEKY